MEEEWTFEDFLNDCDGDPIVAEVRQARDKIFRRFNYDLHAYCLHLMAERKNHSAPNDQLKSTATDIDVRCASSDPASNKPA